jgi:hypothetical protein
MFYLDIRQYKWLKRGFVDICPKGYMDGGHEGIEAVEREGWSVSESV